MFGVMFVEAFCIGMTKFRRGSVGQRYVKSHLDVWDIQGEAG